MLKTLDHIMQDSAWLRAKCMWNQLVTTITFHIIFLPQRANGHVIHEIILLLNQHRSIYIISGASPHRHPLATLAASLPALPRPSHPLPSGLVVPPPELPAGSPWSGEDGGD